MKNINNIKEKNRNVLKYEEKKNFFKGLLNTDKDKFQSFYNKFISKNNFKKEERDKVFQVRNTFMTTFNENKDKEKFLLESLTQDLDYIDLESYVQNYKSLMISNPKFPSVNMLKIHGLISVKKENWIISSFQKNEIKNKEIAEKILEDIKLNKWNISDEVLNRLIDYLNY